MKTYEKKSKKRKSSPNRELPPELQDFLHSKETTQEIGLRYGISAAALTMKAKRAGLPLRQRGRRRLAEPTAKQKEILSAAESMGCQGAAAQFGLSKQRISQLVQRWKGYCRLKPRLVQSARITNFNQSKDHVVSFRIDKQQMQQLTKLMNDPQLTRPNSPNQCARLIVYKFLAENLVLKKGTGDTTNEM